MKNATRLEIGLTAWMILAVVTQCLLPRGPLPPSPWLASLYVFGKNEWNLPLALSIYFRAPSLSPSYAVFNRRFALSYVALTLGCIGFLLYGVWAR